MSPTSGADATLQTAVLVAGGIHRLSAKGDIELRLAYDQEVLATCSLILKRLGPGPIHQRHICHL